MQAEKTFDQFSAEIDWSTVDWAKVTRSLFLRTQFLTRSLSIDGISTEDIVQELLVDLFTGRLRWKPKLSSLEMFLSAAGHHRLIDHWRRHQRIAGSFNDPAFTDPRPPSDGEIENALLEGDIVKQTLQIASNDDDRREIKSLIEAALEIDPSRKDVNQQLAELTGTTTLEVARIKRRIQRRMANLRKESAQPAPLSK